MAELRAFLGLTHKRVIELLSYDDATGIFRWRNARRGIVAGEVAGTKMKNGYVTISVDCHRQIYAHRLAWFYIHGEWPQNQIDHEDRNHANNSIRNLRLASNAQNQANRMVKKNKGLPKGVYKGKGANVRAAIKHNGKYHHLGTYKSPAKAHSVYLAKARELFGEFARSA